MKLKGNVGIAALVLAGIGAVAGIGWHRANNFINLGFTRASYSGSVGANTGKGKLTVARNEPIQLNFAARDWDGLQELVLYEDDREILRETPTELCGRFGTSALKELSPGEHVYRLVATDPKRNVREATVRLTVEDRLYDGPLIEPRLSLSYGISCR